MQLLFSELSTDQIQEMIYEAEENKAFLPYKLEANQTIKVLINEFSEVEGFRLFGVY